MLQAAPAGPAADARLRQELGEEMCCPITQELMRDPVIAEDGHTYDRAAMEQWLSKHDTSPMTNEALTSKALFPNLIVRRLIASHVASGRVAEE
ncbi:hypothetical protein WJX72_009234 [[Myrmecia] bisecta]|uniref:U-box domain-containing protein n=1 Tax=[Myrmecia] bisecta TaxID=41462 RepID=A0AAW1PEL3_9CHLO